MNKSLFLQCCFAAALPHVILLGLVTSLLRREGLPKPEVVQSPYAGLTLVEGLALLLTPVFGLSWLLVMLGCTTVAAGLLGFYFHKDLP